MAVASTHSAGNRLSVYGQTPWNQTGLAQPHVLAESQVWGTT